jgi:hypothetical protein
VLSTSELASQRLLKFSHSWAPLPYYEPPRAVFAAGLHFGPGGCQSTAATWFQIRGLWLSLLFNEEDLVPRGLRPPTASELLSSISAMNDSRCPPTPGNCRIECRQFCNGPVNT